MPQTFLRREMMWTEEEPMEVKWYMGKTLPDLGGKKRLRKNQEPRNKNQITNTNIQISKAPGISVSL